MKIQIDAMKNFSCKYCKKYHYISIDCHYHELHCPCDVIYRYKFQSGAATERNGDFKEIEQGVNHTHVVYRRQLAHDSNMDNLKIAVNDAITFLQVEVAA